MKLETLSDRYNTRKIQIAPWWLVEALSIGKADIPDNTIAHPLLANPEKVQVDFTKLYRITGGKYEISSLRPTTKAYWYNLDGYRVIGGEFPIIWIHKNHRANFAFFLEK